MSVNDNESFPDIGCIEVFDESLQDLLDLDTAIEVIADGFAWTEGPAWDPHRQKLYFSDIPKNRIHNWDKENGLQIFLQPGGREPYQTDEDAMPGTNGLWVTEDDKLIICNQDARSIDVIHLSSGQRDPLACSFNGLPFNSPNDVIRSSKGHVYFTDPPFGLKDQGNFTGMKQPFRGVYRHDNKGITSLEVKDMSFPNGLNFSPDERFLYVSQSDRAFPIIKRFPVDAMGYIGEGDVFYNSIDFCNAGDPGLPDGMTVDVKGNLFATIAGGVAILSPEGKLLGRIATGKATANCTFGEKGSTLFITAHDTLLRVETKTLGLSF